MNRKKILLITALLGLVLVPLVAAAPYLKQSQNGDMLQTRDQMQTIDCETVCDQERIMNEDCLQAEDCARNRERQNLQLGDCNGCICNGTQVQLQERLEQHNCTQSGNPNLEQYGFGYQYQFQHRNQAP